MMNLVAEPATGFRPAHRSGIGIGLGRPRVGDARPIAALEGAVLPPSPGEPIALSGVLLPEDGVLGRRQGSYREARPCGSRIFILVLPLTVEEFAQVSFDGPPGCQGI